VGRRQPAGERDRAGPDRPRYYSGTDALNLPPPIGATGFVSVVAHVVGAGC
jgi:dihydrodipicolinate synthase/N-acetylneuraminate lyase